MSALMQDFHADIPLSLRNADDILTRYGRWASNPGGPRTCGSAERFYRPPGGEALEERRTPQAPLDLSERMAAQRALARVPEPERIVLAILYVPQRWPVGKLLRVNGIPPRVAAERHLVGLRIWANLYAQLRKPMLV